MVEFFQKYDLLVTPGAPTAAFDVNLRAPATIGGKKLENYMAGSTVNSVITVTGLPCHRRALRLRPVRHARSGLQLVGKPRGEAALLQAASLYENLLGLAHAAAHRPQARNRATILPDEGGSDAGRHHRRKPRHRPRHGVEARGRRLRGAHPLRHRLSRRTGRAGARTCAPAGCKVKTLRADMARPNEPARVIAAAVKAMGGIDAIVGNAGITAPARLVDLDVATWDRIFDIDLRANWLLARRRTASQESKGSIVMLASVAGVMPQLPTGAYSPARPR